MSAAPREGAGAGTVALAFLAGAAVGALVALLLAPRPGAEAREKLAAAAGEKGRQVRDAARAAADAAAAAQAVFAEALKGAREG